MVSDVENDSELEDPDGSTTEILLQLGTKSLIATPMIVRFFARRCARKQKKSPMNCSRKKSARTPCQLKFVTEISQH